MLRGTRVAQVAVDLAINGDGMNEQIVSSVEEAGPGVEKAGEDHGEKYSDGFDKGSSSRLGGVLDKIKGEFSKRFGSSGDDAGDQISASLGSRVLDGTKDLGDKVAKELGDRLSSNRTSITKGIEDAFGSGLPEQLSENFSKSFLDDLEARLTSGGQGVSGPLGALFDKILTDAVSGNGNKNNSNASKTLGDRIGALLGAGSRNNALNIFGRSLGGIVDLVSKVTNGASTMFKEFSTGFSKAEQGASFISKAVSGLSEIGSGAGGGLSKAFGSIAASGPAAIAVIAALAIGLTLLVSIASALLAVIAALAATITSALVGALAVASGGVLALVAAGGLLVDAFISMDNTQKTLLKDAFIPLHNEAIGLGQTMLTQLVPAFAQWSKNLQVALALAAPLASVMGGAFAQAGNILTAALSGPGVQMLLTTLATTLPGIVVHLSAALGQFINGLSGLFSAILPFVEEFAIHLQAVATTFANWATSANGQNAIVDFVTRALVSLNSLWGFIKSLGSLLAEVLFSSSGQSTGNNIFDSMASSLRNLTAYLATDDHLQKWFAEGLTFADALGKSIQVIGVILTTLNQSGVIDGIATIANGAATAFSWFSRLKGAVQDLISPISAVSDLIGFIGKVVGSGSSTPSVPTSHAPAPGAFIGPKAPTSSVSQSITDLLSSQNPTIKALQVAGAGAAADTAKKGQLTPGQIASDQAIADSYTKNGQTLAAQISNAINTANKTIANAITSAQKSASTTIASAANSTDAATLSTTLQNLITTQSDNVKNTISTLKTNASNLINTAQDGVNTAAQALAAATTTKAQKTAQAGLDKAVIQLNAAKKQQKNVNTQAKDLNASVAAANAILTAQSVLDPKVSASLAAGFATQNATMADYADARAQVAQKLQDATTAWQAAVSQMNSYETQVADSVKSFGALTTAQAQVINGVTQALTAGDITANLQDRLTQIKAFQSGLQILLAEGLNDDAYKQLVDAGVDSGSAYVQALISGGKGAITQVNSLTTQIGDTADQLGTDSSTRLYQAGVDSTKGLVDGLTSLSSQLSDQATALGQSVIDGVVSALTDPSNLSGIAAAAQNIGSVISVGVAAALQIASPSKVMIGMMDHVGDGITVGLGNQHQKVGNAATALSGKIAVSPEVAQYAAMQEKAAWVSGNQNQAKFRDLIVQTPTEDPEAVAKEVLNEVVGRL